MFLECGFCERFQSVRASLLVNLLVQGRVILLITQLILYFSIFSHFQYEVIVLHLKEIFSVIPSGLLVEVIECYLQL